MGIDKLPTGMPRGLDSSSFFASKTLSGSRAEIRCPLTAQWAGSQGAPGVVKPCRYAKWLAAGRAPAGVHRAEGIRPRDQAKFFTVVIGLIRSILLGLAFLGGAILAAHHANAQPSVRPPADANVKPTVPPAHPGAATGPAIRYVPGSTVKLEQLVGEEDKERHQPTRSRTVTRYQLQGTDLGYSFEHKGARTSCSATPWVVWIGHLIRSRQPTRAILSKAFAWIS